MGPPTSVGGHIFRESRGRGAVRDAGYGAAMDRAVERFVAWAMEQTAVRSVDQAAADPGKISMRSNIKNRPGPSMGLDVCFFSLRFQKGANRSPR